MEELEDWKGVEVRRAVWVQKEEVQEEAREAEVGVAEEGPKQRERRCKEWRQVRRRCRRRR